MRVGPPFRASVGFTPAGPHLARYRAAISLSGLPSGSPRRGHTWSATERPSPFQASVGFTPAGPQLVRYRAPSRFQGFRRVHPGGATTGPLPSGHLAFRASVGFTPAGPQLVRYRAAISHSGLPSGSPRRGHNWSATVTPRHTFGRVPHVPLHRHAAATEIRRRLFCASADNMGPTPLRIAHSRFVPKRSAPFHKPGPFGGGAERCSFIAPRRFSR